MEKNRIFENKEVFSICKFLIWMDFMLLVLMRWVFIAIIFGPTIVSNYVAGIFFYGEKNDRFLTVYFSIIALFVMSLILLKIKNRFFALVPMILYSIDFVYLTCRFIMAVFVRVPDVHFSNMGMIFMCFEGWQAYMFFRCFTGCKDIDVIIRADTNENDSKNISGDCIEMDEKKND